jgi:hypothetical protein
MLLWGFVCNDGVCMEKTYAPPCWIFLYWYTYEAMLYGLDGWRRRCERQATAFQGQGLLSKEQGKATFILVIAYH